MKEARQKKIIELISSHSIQNQAQLSHLLKESGCPVAQATISRDIRELNLFKVVDSKGQVHYGYPSDEVRPNTDKYYRVLHDGFDRMDTAQNLLVLKTVPGMAMAVAAAIDAIAFQEIVGSIAGDDTIMIATKSASQALRLHAKIMKTLDSERDRLLYYYEN
ncbi:MAG: arginine repressor [Clostridium sp.]|jgi:transcriptional regulator of arginine metabolism|nr:arginine repressor [Clostridium sp.]